MNSDRLPEKHPEWCPRLENLSLDLYHLPDSEIIDAVTHCKYPSTAPLRQLELKGSPTLSEQPLARLVAEAESLTCYSVELPPL